MVKINKSSMNLGFMVVIGFLITIFSLILIPSPVSSEVPKIITLSTYDVGASAYIQAAALGDGIMKKTGLKLRIVPLPNEVARLLAVKTKMAHFTLLGTGAFMAQEGRFDFATYEWGPQALRVGGYRGIEGYTSVGVGVRKDSDIKTLADIKGKRHPYNPGTPTADLMLNANLAYAGYTRDDVILVPSPSYTANWDAVISGKVDFAIGSTTFSKAYELAASTHGIRWLSLDPNNKEGWKRIKAVVPYAEPIKVTVGAGLSEENFIHWFHYPYPNFVTYPETDEDLVYAIMKAIVESFDLYKGINNMMPAWELKKMLAVKSQIPFHRGAIKYLKEIGAWTPELDAWNEEKIADQKRFRKAWEAAADEAMGKKMRARKFPGFWEKRLETLKKQWRSAK